MPDTLTETTAGGIVSRGGKDEQAKTKTSNFGLLVLAGDKNDTNEAISNEFDIVAVHGLYGNRTNTWGAGGTEDTEGNTWLKDKIIESYPGCRVTTFGYDATYTMAGISTRMGIREKAIRLLDDLLELRKVPDTNFRPIGFIAHDLGGTIIKEALWIASLEYGKYGTILQSTRLLVFFGCPHRCSSTENMEDKVAKFLLANNDLRHAGALRTVNELGRSIREINGYFSISGISSVLSIVNVYSEGSDSTLLGFDKYTATLDIPFEERVACKQPHRTMCKLQDDGGDGDSIYGRINQMLPVLESQISSEESEETLPQCLEMLQALAAPLPLFETVLGPNSRYHWISQHESYTQWIANRSPSLLHIYGSTGTSEASEYIFQTLQDRRSELANEQLPIYFAFDKHDDQRNSLASMLNTLISQILSHKYSLAKSVSISFKHLLVHRSWTEVEMFSMLRSLSTNLDHKGILCVIDGLDVCGTPGKNFLNDLNAYTTNTERHMKFAIVSTANSGLETALAGWPSINIDDHAEDFGTASTRLASEIDLEVLELVQLSPGWSKFEKTIRDYLFDCGHDKHWRCLVLNDFRKSEGLLLESRCRDELDLLKPTSRASTFTRILGKIPPDRQTFARKALSWALYAFRPLSIWEFGIAVSLENHSTHEFTSYPDDFTCQKLVHDLDGLFGGLLVIKEYQLCFGHPDIREFLLAADHEQWYDTRETGHEEITNACFAFISSLQMLTAHAKPPDEAMWPIYIPRRSFCMYAIKYWPRHYEHIPGTHRPTRRASIFLRNMKVVRGWAEAYWWASNSVTRTDRSFISLLPIFAGLGFKDMVKTWLAFDVDEPGSRQDRALALVEAARNAQLEVIRLLLPFNGFDQAILQDALLAGTSRCDEAVLEELITYAATNFETFSWPPCLLCRSAFFGFEKLVRKLLDSGALYDDAITDYGHTPYILAIRGGHLGVVKILLEHKADFTKVTTKNKRLPLSHAAVQGSASIVKVLLDAGADVNSLDSINQSPVHLATIWGKHEAVEVLVEAGADLGSDETVGWSPLTIAADEGYLKCTRLLLEGKANTEVRRGKWTPLRYAGFNKDVEMCQLLLDYKADPNTRGNDSGAPIICVRANGGDFEIVKLLVEHGAAIDGASSTGWTALHNACNNGHAPMVAYLLDHGADIEGVTSNGETPLILALRANMPEVVELLIDSGADVHKTGRWGWAPIHIAQNEEDLTRILLKTSADPNLVVNDLTPLYIAADNDRGGVVKLLLPRCTTATLEFEHKHGSNHYSAFAIAVNNGYNGIARDLLEAGANINFRSNNNNFPLQYPVYSTTTLRTGNAEDVLRVLLEYAPALDLVDDDGDTAMNCVLESTPLGVAKLLVNAGSNLEIRNKEKDTALGKAIKAENFEVAKYLVRKNVNVNVTGGIHGGPLHIACRNLRLDFVKMLVEAGADVDLLDTSKAGTPLTSACGWTALGWNTEQSRQDGEEIVRYLLDYGKADVKILGGQLGCALNAVCGWATPEIIKLLLERGASVDVADPMGRVAIHYAATRTMEHFQPIHGAGADVESRDKMGRTALHWAVIGCSLDILDRVISLSRGFVDQTDNDGWTPLLWAARGTSVYGRELSPTAVKDVITLLLERGADPCVKGAGHDREWTPVKVARYHRVDQSIIRLLISKAKEKPGKDKWDEKLHASRRGTRRPPFCDCCLTYVIGIRYKCETCLDYDLCYKCYNSRQLIHDEDHTFKAMGIEDEFLPEEKAEEETKKESDEDEDTDKDESSDEESEKNEEDEKKKEAIPEVVAGETKKEDESESESEDDDEE